MTLKEEIIETLNNLSEARLPDVLAYLQQLQSQEVVEDSDEAGWEAYLESEQERQEVYRQLADA